MTKLIFNCFIQNETGDAGFFSEQHIGRTSPERMGTWFMSLMFSLTKCPMSKISALTIELLENTP